MKRPIGASLTAAAILFFGTSLFGQHGRPTETRELIADVQNDLRSAAEFERRHHGKEVERYRNAEHHLSDFDNAYTRGHFDKDKLDVAIDDLKNVVDHNTLDPPARDDLTADLQDLRSMRAEHGR